MSTSLNHSSSFLWKEFQGIRSHHTVIVHLLQMSCVAPWGVTSQQLRACMTKHSFVLGWNLHFCQEWVWAHLEMVPCPTSEDCRGWAGAGREIAQHPVFALLLLTMNPQATVLLSKVCFRILLRSVCQGAPLFFSIMNISLSLSLNYMVSSWWLKQRML